MNKKEKVKKPFYKKWWVWILAIIIVFAIASGGEDEKEVAKEPKKQEQKAEKKQVAKEVVKETNTYTATNAFSWLKDSGLVSGEAVDVTDKFKGSEGLVKALRTDEADIMEFKKDENAKKYHNPDLNSYAVKNIYILVKKGEDNAVNFVRVLESGKAATNLETAYASDAQKAFVEQSKNADFVTFADSFYALSVDERSSTFDTYIIDKEVNWSGTIADLEAIGDSVVVYGKDNYNNEDWSSLNDAKKDMLPYTFVVELKDEAIKKDLKKGDKVTVKGIVGARGDVKMKYNWKLYEGEIIK